MAKDNSTLILVGALGVGGYFAYTQGMLDPILVKLGFQPHGTPTPSGGTTGGTSTGGSSGSSSGTSTGGASTGATAVPPVGAVVNAAGIAAQVAAKDPYIIPSPTAVGQSPSGYVMIHVQDKTAVPAGVIYLRADLVQKNLDIANNDIAALNLASKLLYDSQVAQNAISPFTNPPPSPFIPITPVTTDTISLKDLKSISGLSGLGDYRRHVFTRTGRVA